MTLKEKIQNDLIQAMKAGDAFKVSVLRLAAAAFHNREIEKRTKLAKTGEVAAEKLETESRLSEEETLEVLTAEVKKRREAAVEYERGGRQDLADKEKKEAEIIKQYLPEEMPEEELKKVIRETIDAAGAKSQKDFGKVMSALMPKIKGRADGAKVSQLVKGLLENK